MLVDREDHVVAFALLCVAHRGTVEVLGGRDVVGIDAHERDAGDGGALLGGERGARESCGCGEKGCESHERNCSGFQSQGQKTEFGIIEYERASASYVSCRAVECFSRSLMCRPLSKEGCGRSVDCLSNRSEHTDQDLSSKRQASLLME